MEPLVAKLWNGIKAIQSDVGPDVILTNSGIGRARGDRGGRRSAHRHRPAHAAYGAERVAEARGVDEVLTAFENGEADAVAPHRHARGP